jgi:hypothetical protein
MASAKKLDLGVLKLIPQYALDQRRRSVISALPRRAFCYDESQCCRS